LGEIDPSTILFEWAAGTLNEFSVVFQEPSDLPPFRIHDDATVLKEEAEVPNIRA